MSIRCLWRCFCAGAVATLIGLVLPYAQVQAADRRYTGRVNDVLIPARIFADWPTYNRDPENDRFSPLSDIRRANVAGLHQICTATLGADVGFETGPIVVDGILYATTIHATYAFDAATCALVWKRATGYPSDAGLANRGAAYAAGLIFRGTAGNHVLALSAKTGNVVWNKQVAGAPASMSAAPNVWRGAVFIGTAGADTGAAGTLMALDQQTGNVLWRISTIPPNPLAGMLPTSSGWGGAVRVAGGSTWSSYTLDPWRGLLLVSTGNPGPVSSAMHGAARTPQPTHCSFSTHRPDKFCSNICSFRTTYTTTTSPPARLIPRKPATPSWRARTAYCVPSKSAGHCRCGRQKLRALTILRLLRSRVSPCTFVQAPPCGVEWNGPAFSPRQQALFVNSVDWCNTLTLAANVTTANISNGNFLKPPVAYIPGAPWVGTLDYTAKHGNAPFGVPDAYKAGFVSAVDARTGRPLWRFNAPTPMVAGITATAGDIALTADLNGMLYAFDATSGTILKELNLHQPVGGGVITYLTRGTQYIAVAAGMTSPEVWGTAGTNSIVVLGL